MVVDPDILEQIGPAVSSGNSFLIYGRPGNGKTFLAEALSGLNTSPIYLPYAIEYQGAIIQIYDAIFHEVIEDQPQASVLYVAPEETYDRRWFQCKRPFIVSGGELALDMLDLSYNPASKIYNAPLQLKANNGIYLVDDFGRQRAAPTEILNRWIVPMERRVDYLTLRTGGKMMLPFECFLVFSTNLRPEELGDEAFLRRIQYKMHLRNPTEREFMEIFWGFTGKKQLECGLDVAEDFLERHYRSTGKRMRRCHPRDILSHALDLIPFEDLAPVLTPELLDRAFRGCFAEVGDMDA
jgi:predicted ATPase with chaperone activity